MGGKCAVLVGLLTAGLGGGTAAFGESGGTAVRHTSAPSQVHSVIVENDFFSPRFLEIEVGDTVQWTNASGLHNVFSCIPTQLGCDTTATETFVSGPPADPIWIYSYTFQLPGPNPYICQSHAPFMTGHIEVVDTPVPTVSGQGLLAMLLLTLTVSTAVLLRRRRPIA
jgi:plastocyanin